MLDEPAKILNVLVLVSTVLILMNIERTFRAAVGTMRWRIKFLVLGLGVIFGARIIQEVRRSFSQTTARSAQPSKRLRFLSVAR